MELGEQTKEITAEDMRNVDPVMILMRQVVEKNAKEPTKRDGKNAKEPTKRDEEDTKKQKRVKQKEEELKRKERELEQKGRELEKKEEGFEKKKEELVTMEEGLERKKEGLETMKEELETMKEELERKKEELERKEEDLNRKKDEMEMQGVQKKGVRYPFDWPAQGNPASGSYRMKERFVKRNPRGAGMKKWNEFKKEMKDASDERRNKKAME